MTNEQRAKKLAEDFRVKHGFGELPIKDMFELVHTTVGIDVISMEASEAEHGLTMTDPQSGRIVIAVATTPHPMRQRSSIAHELGHILAGDLERGADLVPGARSAEEICADGFARHLLLPLEPLRHRFARGLPGGVESLSEVVQEFEVSPRIAAIQMREVGAIDVPVYDSWMLLSTASLATRFGWLSQYRSLAEDSRRPRAPQRLMARAVAGYHVGVIDVTELGNWYEQTHSELVEQLGPPGSELHGRGDAGVDNVGGDFWDDGPLFPPRTTGSGSDSGS